jgi:hypothetical protein
LTVVARVVKLAVRIRATELGRRSQRRSAESNKNRTEEHVDVGKMSAGTILWLDVEGKDQGTVVYR